MTTPNPMLEIAAKAMSERLSIDLGPDDHCVDRPALLAEVFKALAAAPLDERAVEAAAIEIHAGHFHDIDKPEARSGWVTGAAPWPAQTPSAQEKEAMRRQARAALTAAFAALTASD